MDDGSITLLVALIVLIAFSAFFSASETAFSSLNQIRLKSRAEEGDTSAARVLAMAEKYDKLLSSILIGNNIVNIAAASIGTVLFTKWLGAERGATTSTIVLTVVVLIFGEVTPKTLAKEMPETIATAVSPVLSLLLTLFTPLTWLFSQWKKLLGRFVHSSESDAITEGELITMVSEAENDGELTDRHGIRFLWTIGKAAAPWLPTELFSHFDEFSFRIVSLPRSEICISGGKVVFCQLNFHLCKRTFSFSDCKYKVFFSLYK